MRLYFLSLHPNLCTFLSKLFRFDLNNVRFCVDTLLHPVNGCHGLSFASTPSRKLCFCMTKEMGRGVKEGQKTETKPDTNSFLKVHREYATFILEQNPNYPKLRVKSIFLAKINLIVQTGSWKHKQFNYC